jgi:hypothetical protein
MSITEMFEYFDVQIKEHEKAIRELKEKRVVWCRENSMIIKKTFPLLNKVYEIIEIPSYWKSRCNDEYEKAYYFKPTNIRFDPQNQFRWRDDVYPTVKGDVYDINMRKLDFYDPDISIVLLREPTEVPNTKNQITSIYLMIDKNTGYYKIGRSKNPKFRESTLQSEKPTIEMIFNIEGKVNDEKVLHDMFSPKRIRGEWFDLNGSDIIQIKKHFNIQA